MERIFQRVLAGFILVVALDHDVGDLNVPVDDVVDVEVLVVVAKGVDQSCSHMHPSTVEDELEDGEEGDDKILDVVVVTDKVGRSWSLERNLCVRSVAFQNELGWVEVLQIKIKISNPSTNKKNLISKEVADEVEDDDELDELRVDEGDADLNININMNRLSWAINLC